MKHIFSLFIILALIWWILSGYPKTLLLTLGLISILFTIFVARRMGAIDKESMPLHLSTRLVTYWINLLWRVVLANLQMMRLVLSSKPDLDPRIIRVRTQQKTDLGKVVLANSITLTPGTVTIDIIGDELEVYAINAAAAADVEQGYFDQRVPVERKA